ncbi:MAG: response regulator [Chitinophagales bacterium]
MKNTEAKKIFIVDDDKMMTEALSDYLTREVAHEITVFHTGEDCLRQLDQNPDYVILDFYLNSVQKDAANGMEILQTIRKNYPRVHVIMLSSQERYGLALQTIEKGAEQYVIKDFDSFEKIAEMIN